MPNDGVPFYLKVDSVRVMDTNGQYMAHSIGDIWIEANADNVGAYGLPCSAPVLQQGAVRFALSAGIKESGQSGVRVIYPFLTTDTFTLNARTDTIYTVTPVFKYIEAATFAINESFNASNDFDGDSIIYLDAGNRCASISINSTDSNVIMIDRTARDLPEGQEIWLEFDYKCDVPFFTGFYGYKDGQTARVDVLFLNANTAWNHGYIKLSNIVGGVRADTYKIFFEALRPYGTTSGTVYIDNVKLVHF